ncbi:hypothetical protein AVEN_42700-1 [Araneus ventricosus]|uniref:FAD-binding domain-containing protein n=1 Tax=Araneus ventricosus TaxID=182803 RepID=A0A4Y2BNK0_ARAVE|nr:hypothetical protein AVEN_42700-1 [Araneus ventricosus]
MKHIVIVGSGPVGSFMAVLCKQLNFPVTVYEKRKEFTRNINLKIDSDLFKEAQNVVSRLGVKSDFFAKFYDHLQSQKNRILIKEMEERFTTEAKSLGADYKMKEVKSFTELMTEHRTSDPLILDCTGRNSSLRRIMFGDDKDNVETTPLQNAMYINFKAIIKNATSLYQVMKNIPGIKLTEVVVNRNKDSDGFTNVTIPVFITSGLATHFDRDHPDINRNPLNPFKEPVSDSIFFPISSIIGNLLVDECSVDLNSVKVKKIVISCGYAKQRSKPNFICLGDSAAHLAFFRSLNLGLQHALELFIHLSMFTKDYFQVVSHDDIIGQFQANNPPLNSVEVYPSAARNVYFVVTKVIWYGCFLFCTTNQTTYRLTDVTGKTKKEIYALLAKRNEKLSKWDESLKEFEAKREEDIKSEISSNKLKNVTFDLTSVFIDINGKSIFKISEVLRAVSGKQSLYRNDFDFLLKCFKARRAVLRYNVGIEMNDDIVVSIVYNFFNQLDNHKSPVLKEIQRFCANENFSSEEKLKLIVFTINNKLAESKTKLNLELVEKTISLWPKLFGLRFDSSEVRLNIVLTLIKNEIRGCTRLFSDSNTVESVGSEDLAGTRGRGLSKSDRASSEDNLLDDWCVVGLS